jgi:hypothetical protein
VCAIYIGALGVSPIAHLKDPTAWASEASNQAIGIRLRPGSAAVETVFTPNPLWGLCLETVDSALRRSGSRISLARVEGRRCMDYSPILSIVTAAFEILVAGWAIATRFGDGSREVVGTTIAILLLLAGYQLAEVAICADVTAAGLLPRLAFIIVTWLPPLGLLLIAQLRQPRSRTSSVIAHGMLAVAAGVVVWIIVDRSFASASVCNAVYARYTYAMPRFVIYSSYYWLGLLAMVVLSGYGAIAGKDERRKRQLALLFGGTLAFVLPSIGLSWFVPPARGALPSIMCHLALLLAICLTGLVSLERKPAGRTEEAVAEQAG